MHRFQNTLIRPSANCALRHSVRRPPSSDGAMCAYLAHQRSFIVTLAWILGKPLTLLFDPFQSIVLFLSGTSPFAHPAICSP